MATGDLAERGDVAGYDRHAELHRLDHREAETFVQARDGHGAGAGVAATQLGVAEPAEVAHRAAAAEAGDELVEVDLLCRCDRAGQQQLHVEAPERERPHQGVDVLVRHQRAHVEDVRTLPRGRQHALDGSDLGRRRLADHGDARRVDAHTGVQAHVGELAHAHDVGRGAARRPEPRREAQPAAAGVVAGRHDGAHVVHHDHRGDGQPPECHLGVRHEHEVGVAASGDAGRGWPPPRGAGGEALCGGRDVHHRRPRDVGELPGPAREDLEVDVVAVVEGADEAADVGAQSAEVRFDDGGVDEDLASCHATAPAVLPRRVMSRNADLSSVRSMTLMAAT